MHRPATRSLPTLPVKGETFPKRFVWGAATAAPQIEGAAFKDGKGESVWDRFARTPGKVLNGDTLDVACDHYHRYAEDFALLRDLGIRHYRLSLAWPRLYPNGDGALNKAGLDFYKRLLDCLHDHDITPWVTLFHWDLPQSLEDRGGWGARGTTDAFATYANTAVRALAGRVKHWITLNEIRCFTYLSYGVGTKAPGRRESPAFLNQTYHHAMLCHGHAVRAVREHGRRGSVVGLTDNPDIAIPVTETEPDIAAARAFFRERNAHILGVMADGAYDPAYLARCGADAPQVAEGDLALISEKTDFLGLNIYTGSFVRAARDDRAYEELPVSREYPRACSAWLHLAPQALYWGPRLATECHGHSTIYITENGCGYDTEPVVNGEVLDLHRRDYLRGYLRELHRAIRHGVPVKGYFLWSLLDNFEWEDGYTRRFGIVHTDYQTLQRTPKLSARWYADVIRENRIV